MQYLILQTNIIWIVWQTVKRITNGSERVSDNNFNEDNYYY